MGASKGEQLIIHLLSEANIPFYREYWLTDVRGGKFRCDFYLPTMDCFIEFNGEQHYQFNKYFYKSRTEFMHAQENDRMKISGILAMQKAIYCIPYWDYDKLSVVDDLFKDEYRATTKYHNDLVYNKKRAHH